MSFEAEFFIVLSYVGTLQASPSTINFPARPKQTIKANKKIVQQQLSLETGCVILLKDISNIITAEKQGKIKNDLDATVKTLMDKYGGYNGCKSI